jgi:hypothetical protein
MGDFYKNDWVHRLGIEEIGGFDYVYDYTVIFISFLSFRQKINK